MPINKNELTKEQIEKAMQCKTADDLMAYAKSEGIDITREEAEAYFAELADVELDGDVLKSVAGGHDYFSQTRQRLLFHGFIRLWLRNSGLCPSNSLATTANFISWNDAIAADGLLMSLPACIILNRKITVFLTAVDFSAAVLI